MELVYVEDLKTSELKAVAKELLIKQIPTKKADIIEAIRLAFKEGVKDAEEVILTPEEVAATLESSKVLLFKDDAEEKEEEKDDMSVSKQIIFEHAEVLDIIRKDVNGTWHECRMSDGTTKMVPIELF